MESPKNDILSIWYITKLLQYKRNFEKRDFNQFQYLLRAEHKKKYLMLIGKSGDAVK